MPNQAVHHLSDNHPGAVAAIAKTLGDAKVIFSPF